MQPAFSRLRSSATELKKMLFNRPRGLKRIGIKSFFAYPWLISGRANISIGNRTSVMRDSRIQVIPTGPHQLLSACLEIGDDVYIGSNVFIALSTGVIIGDGCVFSDYVYLNDTSHGTHPARGLIMTQPLESKGCIDIGNNCFLGYRSAVMPGVTLGPWCIVGANSVVTKSFTGYSMIAGSPARLIKTFSHESNTWVSV